MLDWPKSNFFLFSVDKQTHLEMQLTSLRNLIAKPVKTCSRKNARSHKELLAPNLKRVQETFGANFKNVQEKNFRHTLLCYFQKINNDVYIEQEAFKLHQCQNWLAKFHC